MQSSSQRTNGSSSPDEAPTEPVDYGVINAVYLVLLAGTVAATRRTAAEDPIAGRELVPLGAAAFALSKALAREKVGSWARAPFVEEHNGHPRPKGERLRHAVGELVTCTRCVGAWSALGVVGLRLASPPAGRVVTTVLATSAVNDWLQAGFKTLCATSNAIKESGS